MPDDWQWSAVFDDYVDNVKSKRVLLDHICVSNELKRHVATCGIAHDVFVNCAAEPGEYSARGERLSDHRPVYCDFE